MGKWEGGKGKNGVLDMIGMAIDGFVEKAFMAIVCGCGRGGRSRKASLLPYSQHKDKIKEIVELKFPNC